MIRRFIARLRRPRTVQVHLHITKPPTIDWVDVVVSECERRAAASSPFTTI